MANENDSVLNNSFGKSSSNYNNNETNIQYASTISQSISGNSVEPRILGNAATGGDYRNVRTNPIDVLPTEHQQHRRDENPFSFKHFLNRDVTSTPLGSSNNSNSISYSNNTATVSVSLHNSAGSQVAAVTTLSNGQQNNYSNNNSNPIVDDNTCQAKLAPNNSTPTPLDSPVNDPKSSTSISSGAAVVTAALSSSSSSSQPSSSSSSSYQSSTGARPKVPQVNNAGAGTSGPQMASSSISATSISSLAGETSKMKRSPRFPSFDSQASLAEFSGTATVGCSNVMSTTAANCPNSEFDSSNYPKLYDDLDNLYINRSYSNYKVDMLPGDYYNPNCGSTSPRHLNSPVCSDNDANIEELRQTLEKSCDIINLKTIRNTVSQKSIKTKKPAINNTAATSHNMNARPSSEFSAALPDFVQDHLVMEQWYCDMNSPRDSPGTPIDFVEDFIGMPNQNDKCQRLPDFLSDGPITIHSSSGRLADVAAGLPDLDSPEKNSPSTQLARLRLENDRLRRELDGSRQALADQNRRALELERRLEQARFDEHEFNANIASNLSKVEENLDRSNKRAEAAQSQVNKLKQQVKQLTAELNILRLENESLREDGAVGGEPEAARRPSRSHQLSRDLLRAASNAENNLRQLLSGVENLRSMATEIEKMDRLDTESTNQAKQTSNDGCDDDVEIDDYLKQQEERLW